MTDKGVKKTAILVEGVFDRREGDHLAELSELAAVANYQVVDRVTQNLDRPHPDYFLGKGKAKEIKGRIKELEVDYVIIENTLDKNQLINLRKMWHVRIIDRFELILEIFIQEAGTQEAITQIRLAALKGEGSRMMPGHSTVTKHSLIKKLERKLELIKKAKDIRRKRRLESGFDLVAIAGYTNAGKSTLMNALTDADVEVSGKMFTTLNTTTRSLDSYGRKILLTDTVGFISRLPHTLVDAFYATLKEVKDADLILLIIDANNSLENIKKKVLASTNTLIAIEAEDVPLIPVLNKIDIAQNIEQKIDLVRTILQTEPVTISAQKEENIDYLKQKILDVLESYIFHLKIPTSSEGMSFVSKIHDKTRITNQLYHQEYVEVAFETNERLARYFYNLINKSGLKIEIINKDELEKQLNREPAEKKEDEITILKTDSGEELVIFDLIEEESANENNSKTQDPTNFSAEKLGSCKTLDDD
jgi:GTP-binding protein HflX